MRSYEILSKQVFNDGKYSLVPIRFEDRMEIMKWRNDQVDVLRQNELLNQEKQDWYFENVINKLFNEENPKQLLFSFLENEKLIGYGGLVHIDWESKNAEVSFLLNTEHNNNVRLFQLYFNFFLKLIMSIAFGELCFVKVHTTFYNISQRKLYKKTIENFGFIIEGKLKKHKLINGKHEDVFKYAHFK